MFEENKLSALVTCIANREKISMQVWSHHEIVRPCRRKFTLQKHTSSPGQQWRYDIIVQQWQTLTDLQTLVKLCVPLVYTTSVRGREETWLVACFVIIKCTKFGPLILRKISTIVSTSCQVTFKAKMHQIVCRLGLGWGELTALPQTF